MLLFELPIGGMEVTMRKGLITAIIILFLILGLSGCTEKDNTGFENTVKYTMYIGLNDKDTYTQLISYEAAEKTVSSIALQYVEGFTAYSAKGTYKDDKDVVTSENSLVLEFEDATEDQMKAIMDEVLKALNQHSVLLEKQKVSREFYEGVMP